MCQISASFPWGNEAISPTNATLNVVGDRPDAGYEFGFVTLPLRGRTQIPEVAGADSCCRLDVSGDTELGMRRYILFGAKTDIDTHSLVR